LSDEPFIKFFALDKAYAYPPVRMDFIRPLVVAPNGALGNPLDQRITRRENLFFKLACFLRRGFFLGVL